MWYDITLTQKMLLTWTMNSDICRTLGSFFNNKCNIDGSLAGISSFMWWTELTKCQCTHTHDSTVSSVSHHHTIPNAHTASTIKPLYCGFNYKKLFYFHSACHYEFISSCATEYITNSHIWIWKICKQESVKNIENEFSLEKQNTMNKKICISSKSPWTHGVVWTNIDWDISCDVATIWDGNRWIGEGGCVVVSTTTDRRDCSTSVISYDIIFSWPSDIQCCIYSHSSKWNINT